MPNHVTSTVEIYGDRETIKEMQDKISGLNDDGDGIPFDFNKIVPPPVFEKDGDWYDWNTTNWGTKWNAYHQPLMEDLEVLKSTRNIIRFMEEDHGVCILESKRIVRYNFDTAWSPPIPVIMALSKMYPDTVMKVAYLEEGNGFAGYMYITQGELKKEIDMSNSQGINEVSLYVSEYNYEETFRGFDDIYEDMRNHI